MDVAVHEQVLRTANEIASSRPDWTFSLREIVERLRHVNENSVRTHVVSRCCKNAPTNHPHKWPYFRRLDRGKYQVEPGYRRAPSSTRMSGRRSVSRDRTEETRSRRSVIHAIVHREGNTYVAECVEVAVVTQAESLDSLVENLREAISLHLEGENLADFGLSEDPRVQIIVELPSAA